MLNEIINLIEDKIAEAECCEDPDISEQYLAGYIAELKMALIIINERRNSNAKSCKKYS